MAVERTVKTISHPTVSPRHRLVRRATALTVSSMRLGKLSLSSALHIFAGSPSYSQRLTLFAMPDELLNHTGNEVMPEFVPMSICFKIETQMVVAPVLLKARIQIDKGDLVT